MRPDPTPPKPGSPQEIAAFQELQRGLPERFRRFSADSTRPYTAVVICSASVDPVELSKIPGVTHYEERSLFNLMLLRHPRLQVIYVTSKRLNPLVIDYFLHQMRGVPPSHARRRLTLLDCDDASARPLTEKLLERPQLLQRIRARIPDPEMAHLVVFNSSPLERTLAVRLGIPLNACDPALTHLGSKTGSRRAFKQAGIRAAPGREGLRDSADLTEALVDLWREVPGASRVVIKLDESFSGEGNAVLDLRPLAEFAPPGASAGACRSAIEGALPGLTFEASGACWESYRAQFDRMGGVCEQWIEGEGKRSPSAQLRINPVGEVQPVSTHDQLLGGPSGQIFLGCTFPASADYRLAIQTQAVLVGEVLASAGVIGRFGVDFLVLPGDPPELYAVEINLRQGGTTHPFNTLKFITNGRYEAETGRFLTAQGQERTYLATDTLSAPEYRGLLPFDLLDLLVVNGVHFGADETGVVFHLLGCLSEYGKLGATAIAPTIPEARALFRRTVALLDDATRP